MRFDLLRGPCAGPIREKFAEAVDFRLSALLQGQRAQEAVLQSLPATGSVAEQELFLNNALERILVEQKEEQVPEQDDEGETWEDDTIYVFTDGSFGHGNPTAAGWGVS